MKALYFLTFVLLLSCSDQKKFDDNVVFHIPDHIEHYRLNVSDGELSDIFKRENISRQERRLAEILNYDDPTCVSDSLFISDIESIPYFTKTSLNKKHTPKVLEAFVPNNSFLSSSSAKPNSLCVPIYRDILVLRENKKVIGYAKICFECSKTHLVGHKSENVFVNYDSLQKALMALPKT